MTPPVNTAFEIAVLGGGSFGTALAAILAECRRRVLLWVRRPEQAEEINQRHRNSAYLEGFDLPADLRAGCDLELAVRRSRVIMLVVPSQSFRAVARQVGDLIGGDQILVHGTKGLELDTFKRMSQILREETCARKIGVLSGPNLARELMAGRPAGALLASTYDEVAEAVLPLFAGSRLRVYSGRDVVGTELAGAFKNIVAIAAGAADGLGLGDNAKALLLTRGLSEMARFGAAMGGEVLTFGGLAGVGDLMATCASPLSRNHQVGERLARGEKLPQILGSIKQAAEGVPTTKAVHQKALQLGLELPIVRAVHGLLYEDWPIGRALEFLMALPTGNELAALRHR
jgi:glycerol-3-phosphate dehydrogenase (NAD(P)+)